MTVNVAVLIAAKAAEGLQTTQYTSTGVSTYIDKFTGTNTSAVAATLSINLVTSGDVAGDQNMVVEVKTLQAGETYTFPEVIGALLGPGDFISTLASAASSITIRASGRVVTA